MKSTMSIQLINGVFKPAEAMNLITQMIHVKIKFHEDRIGQHSSEEDIKYRESRIKHLQKELFELRRRMERDPKAVRLDSVIEIVES